MSHVKAHKTAKIAARKRTRGKPFKSGPDPRRNTGGRPKAKEANRILAEIWDEIVRGGKSRGELLLRSLFALAADKNKMLRLAAIKEVLDRRLGKPTQAIELHEELITVIPAPRPEDQPQESEE